MEGRGQCSLQVPPVWGNRMGLDYGNSDQSSPREAGGLAEMKVKASFEKRLRSFIELFGLFLWVVITIYRFWAIHSPEGPVARSQYQAPMTVNVGYGLGGNK